MGANDRFFPFSAIVGQEKLKAAYLSNLIDPRIGGLLISGPKGTGKSTIVHSVAGLLPQEEVVNGCPFGCRPDAPAALCTLCREIPERRTVRRPMRIVNLPLSCTEDRLIGSINIEKLLSEGKKVVQAGILGEANGGILYVDEVNLLPDHLVDDILDAAASHWNSIEREGVSVEHPAEFVLVGSMNPEEGELRPQILDRFPLCARVETIHEAEKRVEIIRRNLLMEKDPEGFHDLFEARESALRDLVARARSRVADIALDDSWLYTIAASCAELKVDGQRPDIVIVKTARALAALADRDAVQEEDVFLAAELTLNHRTRDGGLLDPPSLAEIRASLRKQPVPPSPAKATAQESRTFDSAKKGGADRAGAGGIAETRSGSSGKKGSSTSA
jgi:Mg-chelatase subunit ChlI